MTADQQLTDGPDSVEGPARRSSWSARVWHGRFRWWTRLAVVLVVVILALSVNVLVLAHRIQHIAVQMPTGGSGQTYVIVGSDSRADLPPGTNESGFGTTQAVPGARADIVLVVHISDSGIATTFAVPRDLLVKDAVGGELRLTLTYDQSPQAFVNAMCQSLGITTNHLIVVDFSAFTGVVDTLGGVTVDMPHPIRDQWSGLDLAAAGSQTINGDQALSLVRSRHPEQLIKGRWVAETDGASQRNDWGGVVFDALRQDAHRARTNPLLLQRLAWNATGSLTTDDGTGVFDLESLASATGSPIDLPVTALQGSELDVLPTPQTFDTLAEAGFDRNCHVS